ncbi:hypothetical protein DL93DRAFT_2081742 [Clavulina sp. PMI_390]|nr:hypothetical protein DL93DRAFT_2081742 [Clavulina sp. PMI_390]
MSQRTPTTHGGISIMQDVTTASCHDGPLEIVLMERLEQIQLPEEEEFELYHTELKVWETELGSKIEVTSEARPG